MRSVSTAPVDFFFNPVRCRATGVRKVRGGVLPLRVLTILGGASDHQGHETAQPVLGVGSRLGEYPYPAYLRGFAAGLGPPFVSVAILHIRLVTRPISGRRCTPALTPSAFRKQPLCGICLSIGPTPFSRRCERSSKAGAVLRGVCGPAPTQPGFGPSAREWARPRLSWRAADAPVPGLGRGRAGPGDSGSWACSIPFAICAAW